MPLLSTQRPKNGPFVLIPLHLYAVMIYCLIIWVTQERTGSTFNQEIFPFSCRLRGVFIRELDLDPDYCKTAQSQYLLIKVFGALE